MNESKGRFQFLKLRLGGSCDVWKDCLFDDVKVRQEQTFKSDVKSVKMKIRFLTERSAEKRIVLKINAFCSEMNINKSLGFNSISDYNRGLD